MPACCWRRPRWHGNRGRVTPLSSPSWSVRCPRLATWWGWMQSLSHSIRSVWTTTCTQITQVTQVGAVWFSKGQVQTNLSESYQWMSLLVWEKVEQFRMLNSFRVITVGSTYKRRGGEKMFIVMNIFTLLIVSKPKDIKFTMIQRILIYFFIF